MKAQNILPAVLIASIFVVLAYYLIMLGVEYLYDKNEEIHNSSIPWVNATILLFYVVGGFVAGALSKQYFIVVGITVGLLSTLLIYQLFTNGGYGYQIFLGFISCAILGGIGGGLSLLLFKLRATNNSL